MEVTANGNFVIGGFSYVKVRNVPTVSTTAVIVRIGSVTNRCVSVRTGPDQFGHVPGRHV